MIESLARAYRWIAWIPIVASGASFLYVRFMEDDTGLAAAAAAVILFGACALASLVVGITGTLLWRFAPERRPTGLELAAAFAPAAAFITLLLSARFL